MSFFGDLSNYIPLGSVTLDLNYGGKSLPYTGDWIELGSEQYISPWADLYDYLMDEEGDPCVPARKLAKTQWIRLFARKHHGSEAHATFRVYVLPDDVGRRHVDRHLLTVMSNLRGFLDRMINKFDVSSDSWEGKERLTNTTKHYRTGASNEDSLFYLFNTLATPSLDNYTVSCPFSSLSIRSVLGVDTLRGLKTRLYPYQMRSVANMIRREVQPKKALDPRFQALEGPTGQIFYYDNITHVLLRDKREYDEVRGGILGESMGLGKTLICLATILATKGHWPEVPPEYTMDSRPIRRKVATLVQMAAAAATRSQIPWRSMLQDYERAGESHMNCRDVLEANVNSYTIPPPESKYSRRTSKIPQGKVIYRSSATLVIVPQNLLSQWCEELTTHVEEDRLNVIYLDSSDSNTISNISELLQYDVILMSRPRFEQEMTPGSRASARMKTKSAKGGCLCSLDEDCRCSFADEYQSPLKDIHFLRVIMDEGHEFSTSGRSGTVYWALRDLRVERRWIVSGTPANGLLGVEVGAATETFDYEDDSQQRSVKAILENRRKEAALLQEQKDLEKLGTLVTGFLQVKPWANSKENDPASWQKYIMPHSDGRRKAKSLRNLLESLVIRHRIEEIEADIQLPPLHNKVVYLQPSWHDKLNVNLFILILTVNAVTSQRVDQDYMFYPKNRRYLNILINNLRQSGFYWTSISTEETTKTMKESRIYLENTLDSDSGASEPDRELLRQGIRFGELVLSSPAWKAFAESHEMGMFVEHFPNEARTAWSLAQNQDDSLLLVGATPLFKAQSWVDQHLYAPDPSNGLVELGLGTMQKMWQQVQCEAGQDSPDSMTVSHPSPLKVNSRSRSNLNGVPRLTKERTVSRAKAVPRLQNKQTMKSSEHPFIGTDTNPSAVSKPPLKSALKSSVKRETQNLLAPDCLLAKSRLCGTASAKLSYLIDQVVILHQSEKILIFYEGDAIAWYIAQALDLIDIRYLIYTRSLTQERQTAYITTFNTTENFRVLLMNVHQAAHGLHIASASRVFFVNPVWQPNVEAQAIKRAHRIGQHRPVYVETLVLKDTLEDQMLQRRRGMTALEHQKAERSLLDDDTMSTIIQNAQFIPLLDEEINNVSKQVARLQVPQQLFARPGKAEGHVDDPDSDLIFPFDYLPKHLRRKKEKQAGAVSISNPVVPEPYTEERPWSNKLSFASDSNPQARETQALSSFSRDRIRESVSAGSMPTASESPQEGQTSGFPQRQRQNSENHGTSNSRRRVGFALDPDDADPPSLFGGNVSFSLP